MRNPKVRGQKRRLKSLLRNVDSIQPSFNYEEKFEHFHVPCGWWISEPKTSHKVKLKFCEKWLEKTEEMIHTKPENNKFCKIVADLTTPNLWNSQIIIFYDETYFHDFFNRPGPYQTWTLIENKSFKKERNLKSDLKEVGYYEVLNDVDETYKGEIWFYGEV